MPQIFQDYKMCMFRMRWDPEKYFKIIQSSQTIDLRIKQLDHTRSKENKTNEILDSLFKTQLPIIPIVPPNFSNSVLTVEELESIHLNEQRYNKKKLKRFFSKKAPDNSQFSNKNVNEVDKVEQEALLNASFDFNLSANVSLESSLSTSEASNVLKKLLKIKENQDPFLTQHQQFKQKNENFLIMSSDREHFNILLSKLNGIK